MKYTIIYTLDKEVKTEEFDFFEDFYKRKKIIQRDTYVVILACYHGFQLTF